MMMFVSTERVDHIVEAYLSTSLMTLYVASIVSFCFPPPHVVDVSGLSICIVLCDFVVVFSMCLSYISWGGESVLIFLV